MLTSVTVDSDPTAPFFTEPPSRWICAIAGCSSEYSMRSSGLGIVVARAARQQREILDGPLPLVTGVCEASRPTKLDDAETSGRMVAVESNIGNAMSERRLPNLHARGQH